MSALFLVAPRPDPRPEQRAAAARFPAPGCSSQRLKAPQRDSGNQPSSYCCSSRGAQALCPHAPRVSATVSRKSESVGGMCKMALNLKAIGHLWHGPGRYNFPPMMFFVRCALCRTVSAARKSFFCGTERASAVARLNQTRSLAGQPKEQQCCSTDGGRVWTQPAILHSSPNFLLLRCCSLAT